MGPNLKKTYSAEDFEAKYLEITMLYDMAEELVNTVESQLVSDANAPAGNCGAAD